MVFRLPWTALLPVVVALVCATPFAFGLPGLQLIYLVPLAFGYWVVRTRTVVDGSHIVVRTAFGHITIAWSTVSSLKISERGWVRAVLAGDREVPLPAVRARHLPVLAAVSGGRVADPLQLAQQDEQPGPAGPDAEQVPAEQAPTGQAPSEGAGTEPAVAGHAEGDTGSDPGAVVERQETPDRSASTT